MWKLKVRKWSHYYMEFGNARNEWKMQLKPIIWYIREITQKKWGNRPKKMETYQQTENLKLFLKTGNGPKKEETDERTESLKLFLKTGNWPKKEETDPKKPGKRIKCKYCGNRPKIFGNPSTLFSFWGISDNSWKKKETDPNSLLVPFPCWGVSIAPFFWTAV